MQVILQWMLHEEYQSWKLEWRVLWMEKQNLDGIVTKRLTEKVTMNTSYEKKPWSCLLFLSSQLKVLSGKTKFIFFLADWSLSWASAAGLHPWLLRFCFPLLFHLPTYRCFNVQVSQMYLYVDQGIFIEICLFTLLTSWEIKGRSHTAISLTSSTVLYYVWWYSVVQV